MNTLAGFKSIKQLIEIAGKRISREHNGPDDLEAEPQPGVTTHQTKKCQRQPKLYQGSQFAHSPDDPQQQHPSMYLNQKVVIVGDIPNRYTSDVVLNQQARVAHQGWYGGFAIPGGLVAEDGTAVPNAGAYGGSGDWSMAGY
jgi:hypothetical protein